jgi:hypothetical protein
MARSVCSAELLRFHLFAHAETVRRSMGDAIRPQQADYANCPEANLLGVNQRPGKPSALIASSEISSVGAIHADGGTARSSMLANNWASE